VVAGTISVLLGKYFRGNLITFRRYDYLDASQLFVGHSLFTVRYLKEGKGSLVVGPLSTTAIHFWKISNR